MQGGPNLGNFVVLARGIHAIRQQHNKELAVRIDPDRGTSETGMTEAVGQKIVTAGAAFSGHNPTERACAA